MSAYTFLIDALSAFDGGHRQVLGPKGTAGIWATYPKPFLSIASGIADQVHDLFMSLITTRWHHNFENICPYFYFFPNPFIQTKSAPCRLRFLVMQFSINNNKSYKIDLF